MTPNAFCHYCGTRYDQTATYPRTCASCTAQVWSNPTPVSIVVVPILDGARTGVLAIRRGIPPGIGQLALVGGFLESHESWQQGGAREVFEETGITIDARTIEPLWWTSSTPKPNYVLLFGVAAPLQLASLPAFVPNTETQERGVVFGPDGLDKTFVFPTHAEAAQLFFARAGITGPHAFERH